MAVDPIVLPPHLGRTNASLYCSTCKGDMIRGTCTCEHQFCPECVGCQTCETHDRNCSMRRRNNGIRKALDA